MSTEAKRDATVAPSDGPSPAHRAAFALIRTEDPAEADGCAADAEKRAAEDAFLRLDHRLHARAGAMAGGLSVVGLGQAWADWATHLALSPGKRLELVWKGWRKWNRLGTAFWGSVAGAGPADRCIEPLPHDRRFSAPEWQRLPYSLFYQSFLLTQQWWHNATTNIPGVHAENARLVEFYSRQFLDMLSPSNFLATNPQLMDRTMKENGRNLVRGLTFWARDAADLAMGTPDQVQRLVPGRDVATTPGKVVFRNRLIELIQYEPQTPRVHPVPILIIPAWIMKYYVLDLSPENSMVAWLVRQGFTVFCVSWKNPDAEDRDLGFDDYRELGVMAALEAAGAITGAPGVHAVGYCLGGTLLAVAAAAMARDGDTRLASMSLLAAQVDFSEAGELSLFVNEPQVALIEDMMWETGYLDQRRMAGTFNMLKSQDLIWSRMTREYLMGERTEPSDLGAWSADATRMPYRMHSEYLRRLYMNNDLTEGRFTAAGKPVFLADIRLPAFVVATERDHIAPWRSVFKTTYLLNDELTFVLASGGHNTGIVSAPDNPKARYRVLDHPPDAPHPEAETWAASAPYREGSWWVAWSTWLAGHSGGGMVPAQPAGAAQGHGALAKAPGDYVMVT